MVKIILLDLNRMAVICIINFANGNIYISLEKNTNMLKIQLCFYSILELDFIQLKTDFII